ncbi:hypothetical protein GCM10022415_24710 [Knoellia locipacati]|uniref:Lipoprotein n=1 Tax=Knoellia locipacati TaxID=882824 RepID=A0A512T2H1_9MICO|nr:hypothetical protein KLO01_24670 [Knoellia locipacati]
MRAGLVGAVVGSAVLLGACTQGTEEGRSPAPAVAQLTWERVALPGSLAPETLATTTDLVVVGAHGPGRPRPHLLVGPDATTLREVALTPRSPYAFEAHWFGITTHGDRIDAIAGARGGAHGNYRWSTWSGDTKGVAEQEQPFGVFGSYGAGDLAGIAYAGDAPVVLGAWQSQQTGMDVATWTRTGNRWARVPSTGTPLASTAQELADARVVTSRGDGMLLGGSVTHLAPGAVEVEPVAWSAPGPSGPWARVGLPRTGDSGTAEVQGARCTGDRCLLTGVTDGHLSVWQVDAGTPRELTGIPAVEIPENGSVPSPVTLAGNDVVVAPTASGSTVLRRNGESWTSTGGPSGTPTSVVTHGDELWVVTSDDSGATTLWRARVA